MPLQFTDDRRILDDSSVPDPARIVLVLNRSGNDFTFTDSFYGGSRSGTTCTGADAWDLECIEIELTCLLYAGATKDGYFHTSFSYLELQYQTIAKGITCPGFNCFISNIFGHTDVSKEHLGYSTRCSAGASDCHYYFNPMGAENSQKSDTVYALAALVDRVYFLLQLGPHYPTFVIVARNGKLCIN